MKGRSSVGPSNVRRNPIREQSYSRAATEAAEQNKQAPRWTRRTSLTLAHDLARAGGAQFLAYAPVALAFFFVCKLLILPFVPHPSPALLAIACLIGLSSAVKGHSPGDMRYAGLRSFLCAVSGGLLLVRWVSGFMNGWENNAWFVITILPNWFRGWGDIDPVLRALLVDPFALLLTLCWFVDTWIPERIAATLTNKDFLTRYHEPKVLPGNRPGKGDLLPVLPFLFATLPTATVDWAYSLVLALGASFGVAYIVTVEVLDILCVRFKGIRTRSRIFAKYSDRRYLALHAIGFGLPRLLFFVLPFGAVAILVAGKGQWLSLLPIAVVWGACTLLYPRHFGIAWDAVGIFETYPGGAPPQAGVHDLSEVVRFQGTRLNLIRFAAYSWVPFLYGCTYHFFPGFPQFAIWPPRWPDLYLTNLLLALAVIVLLPGQLFCGVLRACFGGLLARMAALEEKERLEEERQ